jgi:spermidine synthase
MSLLWLKNSKEGRYEVRAAGNSVRLYSNGVFHSQYNPARPISGSVWDLLMLPAFFYSQGSIQRVLVLGVGGGTVIRLLNRFVEPQAVVGVELNPLHLQIARRYFGVGKKEAQLVQGDAVAWLRDYQGPPFDMIIDDLFGDADGEPQRAVEADAGWFRQLCRHLKPDGLLVMNFIGSYELEACGYFASRPLRNRFASVFRLSIPKYENAVAAFLPREVTSRQLRSNLIRVPGLNPQLKGSRLNYHIRRL